MTPIIHTQQKRRQVSFCAFSSRGCIDEPSTTKNHSYNPSKTTYISSSIQDFRSPLLQSCKTCPINHRAYPFRVPTHDMLVKVARSYEFDVARTDECGLYQLRGGDEIGSGGWEILGWCRGFWWSWHCARVGKRGWPSKGMWVG
jgi:hypothetical protein